VIASRLPEQYNPGDAVDRGPFISREALGPGVTFALSVVGFAAVSAFIILSLDQRGIGHGPEVFSVFAATVVATRLVAGGLPDKIGAARCAVGAALTETVGLILLGAADNLTVVIFGAIGMGAAFSLLFPSLSLVAINRVGPERRGVAMGTFTANFDLGMLVGSPAVGAAAALGGYSAAFYLAAVAALACAGFSYSMSREPAPEQASLGAA
jgi:MFS family permease